MDPIAKQPLKALGYDFIPSQFLPDGKDEYHLRNLQNRSGIAYRILTAYEIEVLVRNNNTSDDWASTSAIGPCFISAAGYPSAWM